MPDSQRRFMFAGQLTEVILCKRRFIYHLKKLGIIRMRCIEDYRIIERPLPLENSEYIFLALGCHLLTK